MADARYQQTFRVLIIGGGSVGLLIGQYLKKLGIRATIYEREEYLNQRPRDWNLGVFWAQAYLDECLSPNLQSKLLDARVDPTDARNYNDTLPIFNAETGDLLVRQPTPGVLRLRRSTFRQLIADGLDIQYGKRLKAAHLDQNVDGRPTVIFEDGSQATGDLLIGCDGAKSRVRGVLLGPEKGALEPLPLACCSTCGPLPESSSKELFELDRTYCVSYHPEGFVAFISLHALLDANRPETWSWMLIFTWRHPCDKPLPEPSEALQWWDTCATKLAEPFKSAFSAAPSKAKIYCERLAEWPIVKWSSRPGKITLAGDAAHPMTFHRGQGLSNAIADASKLCKALEEHVHAGKPIEEVLATYENEVVERGRNAVVSSTENSMLVTDWARIKESAMFKIGISKDNKSDRSNSTNL